MPGGRKRERPLLAAQDNWKARAETKGDVARHIHEIKEGVVSYSGYRQRLTAPYGQDVTNKTCKENAFLVWVERTRATKVDSL